jgi:single-stranded DNA-binding protein
LKKGSPVHIEGRLRSYQVENKEDGTKRTKLEVEARRVQILEKTSPSGSTGSGEPETASAGADIEEVPF